MSPVLAQLGLVAQLVFANGQSVVMARNPDIVAANKPGIIVTFNRPGYPSLSLTLSRWGAAGWAYNLEQMAASDTVAATVRKFLPIVKNTVTCGAKDCAGAIIDVTLFGKDYAYLRPGPFPKNQLRALERVLYFAGGWNPDSLPPIPFIWRAPT